VIVFGTNGDEGRRRRSEHRTSRRNKLFWPYCPESRRLEPRTLLSLTATSFPIPLVALVQPEGITKGPDGNLWFAETGADKIGRMTSAGVLTQFALPPISDPADPTAGSPPGPTAITTGPDGALWFVGVPGEVGQITTAGVVTEFPVREVPPPAGSPAGTKSAPATLTSITAGPDGALWFTGVAGEVGRITTAGVVTEFAVPEIPPPPGSPAGAAGTPATPQAITAGPDGALWFTFANVQGEVGRITTAGVVTEFAVPEIPPPTGSPAGTAGTPLTLLGITAGPDGALWFGTASAVVGRITKAGVVTEFPTPGHPEGSIITTGPNGNLWFTGTRASGPATCEICMLTPTGVFTAIAQPAGTYQSLGGLTLGPDGNVWFTEKEKGTTAGQQPAVGEINASGVTKLFPIPLSTTLDPNRGVDADPGSITTGPDGALWFTDNAGIGRITTDGTVTQFPLTTPGAIPSNITSGPGGALWFTQLGATDANGNSSWSIGEIATTGAITVYPLAAVSNDASWEPVGGITEGPDGNLWFTENLPGPHGATSKPVIGRITASGQIQTFDLPRKVEKQYASSVGNIKIGPDGDLWFPVNYTNYAENGHKATDTTAIGRITTKGNVKVYHVSSIKGYAASYHPSYTYVMSGADGELWYEGLGTTGSKREGPAQVSTSGKLRPDIRSGFVDPNTVPMPNGDVWFEYLNAQLNQLELATRSGVVLTQDVVGASSSSSAHGYGNVYGLTLGPDGNLWATSGASNIVRLSGLESVVAGSDNQRGARSHKS
jgi:streptogramin lyase